MLASSQATVRSFAKLSISPDNTTNSLTLDRTKCVSCGMCVKACKTTAGQGVLKLVEENGKKVVTTVSGKTLQETSCIKCGQCTLGCPTNALMEKDQISEVEKVLANPQGRVLVCHTAPSIRVNLSDALGLPAGTISTGKMVTALKMLGFQYVFDTNFSADLTIVEEATELVQRLTTNSGPLPMFTSCCPAWVNYVEQSDPKLIPHLSSCRSPMGMLSALIKSEFAESKGAKPSQIYNVAIMPCVGKKDEAAREALRTEDGVPETDVVLSTRELMRMIKKKKINFKNLSDTPFDKTYGESTGAGAIFGVSGGVMEAAVRSAYTFVTGNPMENVDFVPVRGPKDGIKIATCDINGTKVGVAVAQGVANAKKLIKKIRDHDPDVADVKFVEVMACPGGCVCGGGSTKAKTKAQIQKRVDAIYSIDKKSEHRRSHENQEIKELYDRMFDGKYGSHKTHKYLHTHFAPHPK